MLLELPWDEPRDKCAEYAEWKKGHCTKNPWKKISFNALSELINLGRNLLVLLAK